MEHHGGLSRLLQPGDGIALLIVQRITAGGQHQAAGGLILPTDVHPVQRALPAGGEDVQEVAVQQGQHRLALRVAEPGVVLHHAGAVGGEHQPEVDDPVEGPALRLQRPDGGQENLVHTPPGGFRRGRDGPHAAGVGAPVAVKGPLVVLAGGHGAHMFAVGKGQHCHLRPGHALLNDHGGAGFAELLVRHHLPGGGLGLVHGGGHHHPLAQGQPVRLDHDGRALFLNIGQRLVQFGKGFIPGGRDVVFLHQFLGKRLAGLDDGGVGPGAEGGYARPLQGVHHPQGQGVVRGHHHKVHGVVLRPLHHAVHVGGLHIHALGGLGNAPVARGAEQFGDLGRLLQFPADGVFPAARPNNQNSHR